MCWSDSFMNLLVIAIVVILCNFKNYIRTVCLALKVTGPPALPILGNVLIIKNSEKLELLGTNISHLYGPITRVWLSFIPFFIVFEPRHLQIILSTNKYSTKNMFYTLLHNIIGNGLITSTGERWKCHRRLIQPYFHINILRIYFDTFHKYSVNMVENLSHNIDVNITKFANRFVIDVLQDAVLGIPMETNSDSSPYRKGKIFMPYRVTKPWLLIDIFFRKTKISKIEAEHRDVLKHYTRKILENKKNDYSNNCTIDNLMEMLMEISKKNPEFTEDDIIDEACTFMLAGQDSVGAALTFTLYFLAAYQKVQDTVMDELKIIFRNTNRPTTFEDIAKMKYLEQCIKESMRLCPSVPIISRRLIKDLPLEKYLLPEGTNILISPFATHRLPHIFPNPLKFDPDRFSEDNKHQIHPYGYIPFSAGPRNCIGYKFALIELKTAISHILRHYQLSLTPGHEKLNLAYRVTLKAKNGIWLRLKKRCNT